MSSPSAFRRIAAIVLALHSVALLAGTVARDEALPNAACSTNGERAWVGFCDMDCPRAHEHHRHPSDGHRHDCLLCRGLPASALGVGSVHLPDQGSSSARVPTEAACLPNSPAHVRPPSRGPPARAETAS